MCSTGEPGPQGDNSGMQSPTGSQGVQGRDSRSPFWSRGGFHSEISTFLSRKKKKR